MEVKDKIFMDLLEVNKKSTLWWEMCHVYKDFDKLRTGNEQTSLTFSPSSPGGPASPGGPMKPWKWEKHHNKVKILCCVNAAHAYINLSL